MTRRGSLVGMWRSLLCSLGVLLLLSSCAQLPWRQDAGDAPGPAGTPLPGTEGWPSPPPDAERATVVRVVDGDTVVVDGIDVGSVDGRTGGRDVRLIGFDTPEVHPELECYGQEATAFARELLGGEDVLYAYGEERTDPHGRALAYLWTVDTHTLVNALMLREGYATTLTFPPNDRYADLLDELAREAEAAGRGLWEAC